MANWTNRLQGMAIRVITPTDAPSMTMLMGELLDQGSLVGVLITLYELPKETEE